MLSKKIYGLTEINRAEYPANLMMVIFNTMSALYGPRRFEDVLGENCCNMTKQQAKVLDDAIEALGTRKAYVIEMRYKDERSLSKVGQKMGISRERVRQLEHQGIVSLAKVAMDNHWDTKQ